jgi:predicted O-methyltransferase YrrM
MLCAQKAKHVYTCERLAPIAKVAREIIKRNGLSEKITLIQKLSTAIKVGEDIPSKVDFSDPRNFWTSSFRRTSNSIF